MLDAMTALHQGSNVSSVKAYLDARHAFAVPLPPDDEQIKGKVTEDRNLSDNWDYLRAAVLTNKGSKDEALKAFENHQSKYPHSEKNESAMYMASKLRMDLSYSSENIKCEIAEKSVPEEEIDPPQTEPKEKCQDENRQTAVKSFQQLMQKYPNGRYFNDARGWLGHLYLHGGEDALALAEYYRMLGDPSNWNARLEAKKSLQMIGHEYDDETLDKVEKIIAGDANTAMAYAYHRIYNYAIDLTYQYVDNWYRTDYDSNNERKKEVATATSTGNHELTRIVSFATLMMKRYPASKVSAGFVLRIAEAQLELQNSTEALIQARKALSLGLQGELRAQALWIKGSCEHQAKDFKAARATFNQLIAEFPKAKLTEGARRLLALTAEDQGDLETALDQYLALDYEYDVAYFVDVLLPTDRLAKFVSNRENIPQHDQLLYALGVRLMRDKRWNEARAALRKVHTKQLASAEYYGSDTDEEARFVKEPDWDWNEKAGIKTSWVMQDLKTIDVLEHLEQTVDTALGDEAKAEAMYQLASFQFDADELLFYNPAAWKGQRYELLFQLDQSKSMRFPDESQIIFEYSQSHETLARAIPIYLEIVNRYPQTRAARDALFSAAVADERLSNLNPYWREIYARGLFAGSQPVDFADLNRLYPNYRWPRSRNGWEPSTRTVNGGPGWAPKPTPLPKLTRTQNFERKFKRYFGAVEGWVTPKLLAVTSGYAAYVRGWLDLLIDAVGVLLAGYFVFLGFHFRRHLAAAIKRLIYPEAPQEVLLNSESRLEKVIGGEDES